MSTAPEPGTRPEDATPAHPREARVGTIVWGLVLVAIAAGIVAIAQGYTIDAELALIIGLGVAGLLLLGGSLATAARRRRRAEDAQH